MKSIVYFKISVVGTVIALLCFAVINIYVDPLFHYHAPVNGLAYPFYSNERYLNDGITRNFEYDAIIMGTSMTENFKTSLFDNLFATKAIKVPMSGASYKEIHDLLTRAFERNTSINAVMWGLDLTGLIADKDSMSYENYPDYLYDDNVLNDVYYLLNKEMVAYSFYVFLYTQSGKSSTEFDAYKNWSDKYEYNGELLKENYVRRDVAENVKSLTEDDVKLLTDNLEQNVISLVREYPATEFYFFIPPYSILYWDDQNRIGEFDRTMDAHQLQIELLLSYENVHLYSFFEDTNITVNLDYYIDSIHYNQDISDHIIRSIKNKEGLLTEENYLQYMDNIRKYYSAFDYDAFFGVG